MKQLAKFKQGVLAAQLAVVGLMVSAGAHAAIDVSAVVTEIEDTAGPVGLIGSAVLLLIVGIAAFAWVKSALGRR